MAKKRYTPLGDTELELLQHMWDLRQASVADVHARVLEDRDVAYTTVMNVMKKLADKGYLEYERQGVAYVYRLARTPQQVRASILAEIVDKAFSGSPVSLVQTLVKRGELSAEERSEIVELIENLRDQDVGGTG